MTTFYVLGSGSGGNAFALAAGSEVLLIDAGFSAREIAKRAAQVGLDLDRVVGLVLTHEHGDHTAGARRLSYTLRAPVIATSGTWDRLRPRMPKAPFVPLALMGRLNHGCFAIEACPTSHDAAESVALAVSTPDGHRIGLAYDLGRPTAGVRFLLRQSHLIVLEANHDEVLLRTSDYPAAVQERIAGSRGHLSNRAAAELLTDLLHPALGAVVLAHLSERCNSAEHARAQLAPVLSGHRATLHVALQDCPLGPLDLMWATPQGVLPFDEVRAWQEVRSER
jgi:phosphoribosyl 1,2-cyclic phosphodiesterase